MPWPPEVVDVSDTPIAGNTKAVDVTGTGFSVWGVGLAVVMRGARRLTILLCDPLR